MTRFCRLGAMALATTWMFASAAALAVESRFHHVHLNATDPVAAAKWYADHWGGQAKKSGLFQTTDFGDVVFIYFKAKPGFEGSQGSVVDHIGFSVKDLDAKLQELKQAGIEATSDIETEDSISYAYVKDPWGTLIEVLEDPATEGFHHVHLASVDPDKTLAWYTAAFGGDVSRFGQTPGIRYGNVWLLVKQVEETPAATKGRSIDHLSWGFKDLEAEAARLESQDVKFTMQPTNFGSGMIAFVLDPSGVLIELVGPGKKKSP